MALEYKPKCASDITNGSRMFHRKYGAREAEPLTKCESHFLGSSEVSPTPKPGSTIGKLDFDISLLGFSNPA
jgi:hypothetical protein